MVKEARFDKVLYPEIAKNCSNNSIYNLLKVKTKKQISLSEDVFETHHKIYKSGLFKRSKNSRIKGAF